MAKKEKKDDIRELDLIKTIGANIKAATDQQSDWRKESEQCDNFVAGHQWDKADVSRMREAQKPAITYNRIQPMVNAIVGTEIQNRQKMIFVPRHPTDEEASGASDLATEAYTWALDQCNGEYERTQAFRDMVVRGIGWMSTRMDYNDDIDGKVMLERVDGMEMHYDPDARKQNLEDANWVSRHRIMKMSEVYTIWPDKADKIKAMAAAEGDDMSVWGGGRGIQPNQIRNSSPQVPYGMNYSSYTPGGPQTENVTTKGASSYGTQTRKVPERDPFKTGYVNITEYQWREKHTIFRVLDPNGDISTLTDEEYKVLKKRLKNLEDSGNVVEQYRYKYHRVFLCNNMILQEDDLPFNYFTYQPMTCFWDARDKIWYGLVRAMIDPQKGANKYFSLGVHLFSVSPKGTMLAESGAFMNPQKVATDWAKPGAVIHLKPGALSQSMVKVEPAPAFPQAATTMIQYSIESLREVTGINMEMLGQSEGSQPGKAIENKQIQGLTIMSPIFNAYTRYRETEARVMLEYLRTFLTDGRWIRIGGPYNAQYLQLVQDDLADAYDLMLDDAPTDPNQKAKVWEQLQPLMPMLVRQGVFPMSLLDYAPLPASVVSAVKKEMETLKQQQAEGAEQQTPEKDQNPEYIQAEIDYKKSQAELSRARAQALLRESNMDVATQAQTLSLRDEDAEIERRLGDDNSADQMTTVTRLQSPKVSG